MDVNRAFLTVNILLGVGNLSFCNAEEFKSQWHITAQKVVYEIHSLRSH